MMLNKKVARIFIAAAIILFSGLQVFPQQNKSHGSFFEDFKRSRSRYFKPHHSPGKDADSLWRFGMRLPEERKTRILMLRIDPEDSAGAGKGPEISSKYFTHFGKYAARIKIPDVKNIQPNVGAVVGYFTYNVDKVPGLSEIDFEWLVADPRIIYIGTWTGPRGDLRRIGRTLNLAEGKIYSTSYRERKSGIRSPLTGNQSKPDSVPAVEGYDASSRFYTYGFDWYPERIRWWMIHPVTADTLVLWDYRGSRVGIPQNHSIYRMNFWYTKDWPVETNPNSIEKPLHHYELLVDWMSYNPFQSLMHRTE